MALPIQLSDHLLAGIVLPNVTFTEIFLIAVVLVVAIYDITTRRIPNFIVLPTVLAGIVVHLLRGSVAGILGATVGFLLLLLPYIVGGMKAGDVKFLMAIGAIVGWEDVIRVLLAALLFYPLIALIAVIRARKLAVTWLRFKRVFWNFGGAFLPGLRLYAMRLEGQDDPEITSVRTPFGASLAAGTLIAQYSGFLR